MRSGISIVPQSPDLFEGTIRENIDPTGASSDAEIWVALEQVRLRLLSAFRWWAACVCVYVCADELLWAMRGSSHSEFRRT